MKSIEMGYEKFDEIVKMFRMSGYDDNINIEMNNNLSLYLNDLEMKKSHEDLIKSNFSVYTAGTPDDLRTILKNIGILNYWVFYLRFYNYYFCSNNCSNNLPGIID